MAKGERKKEKEVVDAIESSHSTCPFLPLTLRENQRIVCLMSDGEHQEGQTWEAVMSAKKWNLDNLIAIMDYNHLQIEGTTDEIMPLGDLAAKYRAFGWDVRDIDGHDFTQIQDALEWADACT